MVKAPAFRTGKLTIGRPYVYGLALAGETGVREVLRNFLADLDIAVAQAGVPAIEALDRSILRRAGA